MLPASKADGAMHRSCRQEGDALLAQRFKPVLGSNNM